MWHELRSAGTPAGTRPPSDPTTMNPHLVAACLAIALALPSTARAEGTQGGAPSNSLSRVQGVFTITDADRDGKISAAEGRAIPVPPEELAQEDLDGDGAWSRDEFTLYYRARLIAGGQSVGADLDAEVARIQALKRVRVVEEARNQGVEAPGGRGKVEPVGVRLEKALVDLEKSAATKKATPEDFRRLRNLVILSGRSVPESKRDNHPTSASARMLQALDRIEKRTAAGQHVREDFETLRVLVASPVTVGEIARGTPIEPKTLPQGSPTPSGIAVPLPNAGSPTDRKGPILGPADARRRATEPRGSTRVAPKPLPQPESAKPAPPQDAKKDPGRRTKP